MCTRYLIASNPDAILGLTRAMTNSAGNLRPELEIFPDYAAPIVRNTAEGRELAMVRWGMPAPTSMLHRAADVREAMDSMRGAGEHSASTESSVGNLQCCAGCLTIPSA